MFGVEGEFVGNKKVADLPSAGHMLFDPGVLLDFTQKNLPRTFDSIAREIFAFRDYAHAHTVVVLGNVPKPAFLRNESDGRCAGINTGITFGALVIGPNGDFVQLRIADAPIITRCSKGFFSGTVERHARPVFGGFAILRPRAYPNH